MHLDCVFSIIGDDVCIMMDEMMGETSPTRRLVDEWVRFPSRCLSAATPLATLKTLLSCLTYSLSNTVVARHLIAACLACATCMH
jgi:arginine deiminase